MREDAPEPDGSDLLDLPDPGRPPLPEFGLPVQTIVAISAAFGVFMAFWPDVIQVALGWAMVALAAMLWARVPLTFYATIGAAAGLLYYGVSVIASVFMFSGSAGDTNGAIWIGAGVFAAGAAWHYLGRLAR